MSVTSAVRQVYPEMVHWASTLIGTTTKHRVATRSSERTPTVPRRCRRTGVAAIEKVCMCLQNREKIGGIVAFVLFHSVRSVAG